MACYVFWDAGWRSVLPSKNDVEGHQINISIGMHLYGC